jgi:2-polyprenyl-3-methyl-5-hydroxy-6-metoxy-1,4-benzoquinol methylase
MSEIIPYSPSRFDRGYYENGERGGFKSYDYESADQKHQLGLKFGCCSSVPHESAFFVGCARGFEVAYWRQMGKHAKGGDVSQWAIKNALPHIKDHCQLMNCETLLALPADAFDLVAAFDVLTLVPEGDLTVLCGSMVHAAKNGIVLRTEIKSWRNMHHEIDGLDGVSYKLKTFDFWDKQFTVSGKFKLDTAKTHFQYETVFVWKRT